MLPGAAEVEEKLAQLHRPVANMLATVSYTHLIITNTGLYTVNLAIMGFSSNVPMLKTETVFTLLRGVAGERFPYKLVLAGGISLAACVLLVLSLIHICSPLPARRGPRCIPPSGR